MRATVRRRRPAVGRRRPAAGGPAAIGAALAVLLLAATALVACSPGRGPDSTLLGRIHARGTLIVGTSADYPPFEYLNEQGAVVGFDIDLIREVARELGVGVEIVNAPFDGLTGALLAERIDVIIAGMTVTPERQRTIAFSDPYFFGGTLIMVHKDTADIRAPDDLKGKIIATQVRTTAEELARQIEGAEVAAFDLFTDAAVEVASGRADAMLVGTVVANVFAKLHPNLKIVGQEIDPAPLGIGLRKNNPELVQALNESLKRIREDGRYDRLVAHWFGGE